MLALLMSLLPLIPLAYKIPLWKYMALPTAKSVSFLLQLIGYNTHTMLAEKIEEGWVIDYHAYVISSDFSVQIGAWCGGFDGIAMFLFLLTFFLLLDWRQFRQPHKLVMLFAMTIALVLMLNILRITLLFAYAEILIAHLSQAEVIRWTVDAFHSNIGLVLYSLAFWPYLCAIYRWEYHTKVTAART